MMMMKSFRPEVLNLEGSSYANFKVCIHLFPVILFPVTAHDVSYHFVLSLFVSTNSSILFPHGNPICRVQHSLNLIFEVIREAAIAVYGVVSANKVGVVLISDRAGLSIHMIGRPSKSGASQLAKSGQHLGLIVVIRERSTGKESGQLDRPGLKLVLLPVEAVRINDVYLLGMLVGPGGPQYG